jgi:RNA polymerase sigma-70 factor (ECF subfamily)
MTFLAPAPPMPTTADDEQRLLRRARGGDQDAFNELAGRYSTRLRRTLYRITRDCDAAYDAVQEALVRAWQSIDRFEGRSRFYTWLTRIG